MKSGRETPDVAGLTVCEARAIMGPDMQIPKAFIWLSILAGVFMALVSLLGVADSRTYGRETLNWAAQAVGQDWVNLCVVFPVLLVASFLGLRRDSFKAFLLWLGVLIYLIYSYTLYSFFVHFGPLFLLYVATLGLSFYSFAGALATLDWRAADELLANVKTKPASALLGTVAVLFALLWLADIANALATGGKPADLDKIGLWINPVHVMDLALLLPGAFIIAVLLWRRRILGLTLGVPLLVFFVLMGFAIIGMMIVTAQKGFALSLPQLVAMLIIITLSSATIAGYLRRIQ